LELRKRSAREERGQVSCEKEETDGKTGTVPSRFGLRKADFPLKIWTQKRLS
jgi:hypothetical protein